MKAPIILGLLGIFSSVIYPTTELKQVPIPRSRNPIGTLDQKRKEFIFDLYPEEKCSIEVNNKSNRVHYTGIYEGPNLIKSLSGKAPSYVVRNKTASKITYKITHGSSYDHGNLQKVRMDEERNNYAKVNWEDGDDFSFDDSIVQFSISPPPPNDFPQRRPRIPGNPMPDDPQKKLDSTKKSKNL